MVKKIAEGVEETDTGQYVECPGFKKKLLPVGECEAECPYFIRREVSNVTAEDKVVATVDRVACGFPQYRPVRQACTISKGDG